MTTLTADVAAILADLAARFDRAAAANAREWAAVRAAGHDTPDVVMNRIDDELDAAESDLVAAIRAAGAGVEGRAALVAGRLYVVVDGLAGELLPRVLVIEEVAVAVA